LPTDSLVAKITSFPQKTQTVKGKQPQVLKNQFFLDYLLRNCRKAISFAELFGRRSEMLKKIPQ
jgi:hypothetical protein